MAPSLSLPSPASSPPPSLEDDTETRAETTEGDTHKLQSSRIDIETDHEDDKRLSKRLDALLESYLTLLDTYTRLREQLSKGFASGFLALAQANRNSALGPGRRYGEEGYDKRMKALKRLQINQDVGLGDNDVVGTAKPTGTGHDRQDSKITIMEIEKSKRTCTAGDELEETGDSAEQHLHGSGTKGTQGLKVDLTTRNQEQELAHAERTLNPEPTTAGEAEKQVEGAEAKHDNRSQDSTSASVSTSTSASTSTSIHHASHLDPIPIPSKAPSDTLRGSRKSSSDDTHCTHFSYSITLTPPSASDEKPTPVPEELSSTPPPKANPKDPLKWYGILVPPALRQCQGHFQSSVDLTVPDLLSTVSALDSLEREIWQVRCELGLLDLYNYDYDYDYDHLAQNDCITTATNSSLLGGKFRSENDSEIPASPPSVSFGSDQLRPEKYRGTSNSRPDFQTSPKRQSLFSPTTSASEPRSRVLKLG
ncbi:hypothetical protein A1O3_09700 [Capronia epimyces CBS 606.96]|uniref:Vacuolar ATPase assembly protein VMA22 n=1 Tax=Capronia epimyces CBS 606.96 TaxID=1182542 RepID=W9Y4V1_9EURO|nr:uncharacterized protein A1O3_09700 [Capronia epimyces CBS 606.96]EXJ77474.1 hypothetical protein A1O3_09700 [Capronia epimyces CBS 606.96]